MLKVIVVGVLKKFDVMLTVSFQKESTFLAKLLFDHVFFCVSNAALHALPPTLDYENVFLVKKLSMLSHDIKVNVFLINSPDYFIVFYVKTISDYNGLSLIHCQKMLNNDNIHDRYYQ